MRTNFTDQTRSWRTNQISRAAERRRATTSRETAANRRTDRTSQRRSWGENQSSWAKERGAEKIIDSTKSTAREEDWKTWKATEIKGTRTRTAQHEIRHASIPLHHVRLQPAEVKGHILAQFTHVHTPHGYKFCIAVYPNGWCCGDVGTHVLVYLWVWCHSPEYGVGYFTRTLIAHTYNYLELNADTVLEKMITSISLITRINLVTKFYPCY